MTDILCGDKWLETGNPFKKEKRDIVKKELEREKGIMSIDPIQDVLDSVNTENAEKWLESEGYGTTIYNNKD